MSLSTTAIAVTSRSRCGSVSGVKIDAASSLDELSNTARSASRVGRYPIAQSTTSKIAASGTANAEQVDEHARRERKRVRITFEDASFRGTNWARLPDCCKPSEDKLPAAVKKSSAPSRWP